MKDTQSDGRSQLVTMGETLASMCSLEPLPLRQASRFDLSIAGAESNVAIGAARLGIRTSWIGRVGDDELGHLIVNKMRGEDLDVRAQFDVEHPTVLMLKSRRTSSIQNVDYYRRESAGSHLSTADIDVALISCADVFHVSAITSALSKDARDAVRSAISTAKRAGTQVSIDLNYRSALWSREEAAPEFRFLAGAADFLFCTVSEAQIVAQGDDPVSLARQLAEYGAGQVVVKQGSDGAISWRDGKSSVVKPIPVSAFDEVGAGDAFAAGFLASLIAGGDPDRNLAWAAAMGAWAVSTRGDWEGLPTLDELFDSLRHNQTSDSVVR